MAPLPPKLLIKAVRTDFVKLCPAGLGGEGKRLTLVDDGDVRVHGFATDGADGIDLFLSRFRSECREGETQSQGDEQGDVGFHSEVKVACGRAITQHRCRVDPRDGTLKNPLRLLGIAECKPKIRPGPSLTRTMGRGGEPTELNVRAVMP